MARELIALMPMKAHSSRVPHKNFRKLHGKPLFRWMLDRLLELDFVDLIVIDTDARAELNACGLPETDRVCLEERPGRLIGDDVSMNRIIEHDISAHEARHYLMTHTTNPAVSGATLEAAYSDYLSGLRSGYDSLFSVTRHQTRFYDREGRPLNHNPANLIPTQELEPWFEENSCYYYFNRQSFARTGARIGARPKMHETPAREGVDIDDWSDWHLAEMTLAMMEREST